MEICVLARDRFSFLTSLGFSLVSEKFPQTNSFKDGFSFKYVKEPISVQIQYYDMEFNILFTQENQSIPFLFIDKYLFNNRSGFQGNMFPREKLLNAVTRTATDIGQNYQSILKGEELVWQKLIKGYLKQ